MKHIDLEEPTSFLDHVYLECTQRECETSKLQKNKKCSNFSKFHVLAWMITNLKKKSWRCWRIVNRMLTSGLEMLVPGTNW